MRKVLSLLVALVLMFSLATAVSAATENRNAEIYYDVQWNTDWECYALKCYLKIDGGLLLTKSGPRYTGSGLYSYVVKFNGITVDDFAYPGDEAERGAGFIYGSATHSSDGYFSYGGQCAGTVQDLHKATVDGPIELFTLYVAGDDKEAIIEKFSDLKDCSFKIVDVSAVSGSTVVTNDMFTTYAVGDDGVTQHVDANYVLVTPESKLGAGESEIAEVATTSAVLTTPKAAMVEEGQAVAMTFAAADLRDFAGMNWELTFADATKKYAKVDYPATTIASLGDAAPVQFVAAFRVKANGGELNAITSIAAGFCNANKELAGITAAVDAE